MASPTDGAALTVEVIVMEQSGEATAGPFGDATPAALKEAGWVSNHHFDLTVFTRVIS